MPAPVSDTVNLVITADSTGLARAGFGTPLLLSYGQTWAERVRSYSSLAEVAVDFPSTSSPEYLCAAALFGQSPKPTKLKIARGSSPPTMAYVGTLNVPTVGNAITAKVRAPGATSTDIVLPVAANLTFTADSATDVCTATAHQMVTGDGPFRATSSGTLPTGLAVDTDYWVNVLGVNTFEFCTSRANALAGTQIDITTNGTGTLTLLRATRDVLNAQLVDRLNAVPGRNYLAAIVSLGGDNDTFTVTGLAAGNWFSIAMSATQTTLNQSYADPGVANDLISITVEDNDWYCLLTAFDAVSYVTAAAGYIQAQKKIYLAGCSQTLSVNGGLGGGGIDTLDVLRSSLLSRTAGVYCPNPAAFRAAQWAGKRLPLDPGSETWKFAQLALSAAAGDAAESLTSTQRSNLRAKRANWLESTAGLAFMYDGTMASGEFIDVVRGLDWLDDDMTVAVLQTLANNPKIPYTDEGVAVIKGDVRASLRRAFNRGIITEPDADDVTAPLVANVAPADRAARLLPDVRFVARLQGAIHKVNIRGVVSV